MSVRMQIRIKFAPPELQAKLREAPAKAQEVLDLMLKDLAETATRAATQKAPYTTGELRRSIQPVRVRSGVWRVVAGASYGAYMEFGTRPHWPPPSALEEWVRKAPWRFGIRASDEKAVRGIAFVVGRAIARRGLKPRGYMKYAFERIGRVAGAIARRYASLLAGRLFR